MTLLAVSNLARSFGGIQAVADMNFTLENGEIRAIIGPNGAGKTTFVSMISGRVEPSGGSICFDDIDITGLRSWERVRQGIVYTFQITSVYRNLSCFENVALAAQQQLGRDLPFWRHPPRAALTVAVEMVLEKVGLLARKTELAGELAYGHQRLLEVAMGLALQPRLLILDEPTQGLSESEIANFCALVKEIGRGATILLIEHNMDVVMELAHRITVMSNGRLLAEGTPAEIMANIDVQRAYLGT
ncbi:MAG: ABC transporter ATP-binding protein [Proteobacteria bacterium]|nr:ABC transporter ATP-binding protein [Pseudomonadota bacterium]